MNSPLNEQPLDVTKSFAYRMIYQPKLSRQGAKPRASLEREIRGALYRLLMQLRRGR